MHLDFAVVADYAIVDQAGKLSVLGIFQHIWVQQFPAMHPRLHLVLRLKGRRTEIGEHRSEEHTSELQSQSNLVCRLLLEKKKIYEHFDLGHGCFFNMTANN